MSSGTVESGARVYSVYVRRSSPREMALNIGIYFGILLMTVGLSKLLFGGSWVIDVLVLIAMVVGAVAVTGRATQGSVKMTPDELRAWVDSGLPDSWTEEDYKQALARRMASAR